MTALAERPDEHERPEPSARGFWVGMALGLPIVALGVLGLLRDGHDVDAAELGRWIAGSAVVHDALVLPVVALVGLVGRRWTPGWAWPAVRWALMTTGALVLVPRPFVAGYGYNPANPTALSRDYGTGVLVALAVVWLAAAGWAATAASRRRR